MQQFHSSPSPDETWSSLPWHPQMLPAGSLAPNPVSWEALNYHCEEMTPPLGAPPTLVAVPRSSGQDQW